MNLIFLIVFIFLILTISHPESHCNIKINVRRIIWGADLSWDCARINQNEIQADVTKGDLFIPKTKRFAFGGSCREKVVQKGCFIGELDLGVSFEGCGCGHMLVLG